jgi:hypothetical protein
MKFPKLLLTAIQRSEIPLRFEPGAEEAVAKPIVEVLQVWVRAHITDGQTEFDLGYRALATLMLAELSGSADLPQ